MKRQSKVILLTMMLVLTGQADELYLRDGSVLQGRFHGL
jgi:hypothetical protein